MVPKSDVLIEVKDVVKSFPGVKALKGVSMDFRKGEVHAICGENGAGKSTLIKILTGVYTMDSGEYYVDGQPVSLKSTHQAIDLGITCIYQELSIVPLLDVANNLFLGNLPATKSGAWDKKTMYKKSAEILQRIGLDISPKAMAGGLSIAHQQMIEIGRALTRKARCIIMDEPTSSLTDNEIETLFQVIGRLKAEGITIVFISHKLDEVMRISDRITVIRDGAKITSYDTENSTREELIRHMVGRDLEDYYYKRPAPIGEEVLRVEHLSRPGVFEDVSFQLRKGEILGFFGLVGAGRSEIMRAIFGIDKHSGGDIYIDGKKVRIRSSSQSVKAGFGLVPEDRRLEGLAVKQNVLFNLNIIKIRENKLGLIRKHQQRKDAQHYVDAISIKTPTLTQRVDKLSGGNQQKIVIAKWLMVKPQILILDEPTRGVDIGAKSEIYRLIGELAQQGVAVIVVSSEMPEVLGICDRVVAVCEGRIAKEFDIHEATPEKVLSAAIGGDGQ